MSDYSVIISIIVFTLIDIQCGFETWKLHLPTEFKVKYAYHHFAFLHFSCMKSQLLGSYCETILYIVEFQLTRADIRGWIVPLSDEHFPWYMSIMAIIPALLLVIIIFIEQHIASVIVNRKEHKLKVRITLCNAIVPPIKSPDSDNRRKKMVTGIGICRNH